MEKDSYEEKSSSDDSDKITGLVDYSSSSEDEDHAPLLKKRGLSDSALNTSLKADGSSKSDSEEEDWAVIENFSSGDDFEMNFRYNILTDNDLLDWGPYSWRRRDRCKREEYAIVVEGESREECRCLELLKEIGCEDRFLGCSIEMGRAFFAQLNEDEATKMQGHKGVCEVIPYRLCFGDV